MPRYTAPTGNITSSVDFFTWLNGTVNNFFFPAMLIAIFFIITIKLLFSTDEAGKSFAAASFICMILAVFLRTANLINTGFMVVFIIFTGIGAVWMHVENAGRTG